MVSLIPNRLNPSQIFKYGRICRPPSLRDGSHCLLPRFSARSKVFWGHGTNPEFEPSEPIYIELPAQMTEAEIDQTVIHIEVYIRRFPSQPRPGRVGEWGVTTGSTFAPQVWDKDLLTENDLIGECEVLLSYVKQVGPSARHGTLHMISSDSWLPGTHAG